MAEKETFKDSFINVLSQGFKEFADILFNSDLDFMIKFLIVICQISFVILVVYLLVPMTLRRKIEKLDYDEKIGGIISTSGALAIFFGTVLGIFKMQKQGISKTSEEKLHENHIEREFRLRQQFFADINTYQAIMLVGIWLTINFVLKLNRQREKC